MDRDTEVSYVQRERDWLARAEAQGRTVVGTRMLPMLPAGVAGNGHATGNGHVHGNGHEGHAH